MSIKRDYWINAIDVILADLDIDLTLAQIEAIAEGAANAADLYGEATGEPGWGGRVAEVVAERDRTIKALVAADHERPHRQAEAEARRTGQPVADLYGLRSLDTPAPWVQR